MAEAVHIVPKLLLLFLIQTGSDRDHHLVSANHMFDITFPCQADIVCFHLWKYTTSKSSGYIGIVSNGEIQTSESMDENSNCVLPFTNLSVQEHGRHYCRKQSGVITQYKAAPVLRLAPTKTVSLQCILLSYVINMECFTYTYQSVSLKWVDELGVEIEDSSQHRVEHRSQCAATLHITQQSSPNRTVRCQLTVGRSVLTSVKLFIRSGGKKRILVEPGLQEGGQGVVGAAVGGVGCVVLTALIAALVVKRRRANVQPSVESSNTVNANTEPEDDADDVLYTEIVFPEHSNRRWEECETTEYASIKY